MEAAAPFYRRAIEQYLDEQLRAAIAHEMLMRSFFGERVPMPLGTRIRMSLKWYIRKFRVMVAKKIAGYDFEESW